MEDIYTSMPLAQQMWLEQQLRTQTSVKEFIKQLLAKAYIESTTNA